jgi:hypothetical protein
LDAREVVVPLLATRVPLEADDGVVVRDRASGRWFLVTYDGERVALWEWQGTPRPGFVEVCGGPPRAATFREIRSIVRPTSS